MAVCLGERVSCVVVDGKHGSCSGLSDTVQHSELPEHLCSGQLDGLLGEGLVACQCGHGSSRQAHSGKRGVCVSRLGGMQRKWQQLRQHPRWGYRRLQHRRRHRRQRYGR